MSQDFERAKAFLKVSQNGQTLYDHLSQVLLQIAQDKPENALSDFEKISVAVKRATLQANKSKEIPLSSLSPAGERKVLGSVDNILQLIKSTPELTLAELKAAEAAKAAEDKEDEEVEEEEKAKLVESLKPAFMKTASIPDMMKDAEMLNWAGVGLSKEEVFTVLLSLQRLARSDANLASLRFFGKVCGTQRDYYIAEATCKEYPKEAVDDVTKKEVAGTGANQYVYFATNTPSGTWTKLPDILPEQIVTARLMRRMLTGVLTNPVRGHPRFPWPEASYLRAQLARISAATTISPKGYYMMDAGEEEDDPEIMKVDPEFETLDAEALQEGENWVHHVGHLLKQGRTTAWSPPENEDEEEEEEAPEEEEEPEEPLPILSGCDGDVLPPKADEEEEEDEQEPPKLWRYSRYPANALHQVAAAYSLQWPGAVAVASGKSVANIYVGYGQKYLHELYSPPAPPTVYSEYVSPFNPEEAEEDEVDPMIEQLDPQPPKEDEGEGDEGDEGDGDEDDDEEE